MKRFFIGIDFSKLKFDAAVLDGQTGSILDVKEFENVNSGYNKMLEWIKVITKQGLNSCLFCGEHTGLYSQSFSKYSIKNCLDFWLESGLRIKHTQGIVRGKSDKTDAIQIADYAFRHKDKAVLYRGRDSILERIKDLLAFRSRLIDVKVLLETPVKELVRVKTDSETATYIYSQTMEIVDKLKDEIKEVENELNALVELKEEIRNNYDLVTSIKGIGRINALLILVATGNFTLFSDARKFGCYCGVVPFSHTSGTSVKGKNRVSHLANKQLKAVLTMAARTAVLHDSKLKSYYQNKANEGKHHRVIMNNVRNKLIHTIFAVVRSQQKYDENYHHPLNQAA